MEWPEDFRSRIGPSRPSGRIRNATTAVPSIPPARAFSGYILAFLIRRRILEMRAASSSFEGGVSPAGRAVRGGGGGRGGARRETSGSGREPLGGRVSPGGRAGAALSSSRGGGGGSSAAGGAGTSAGGGGCGFFIAAGDGVRPARFLSGLVFFFSRRGEGSRSGTAYFHFSGRRAGERNSPGESRWRTRLDFHLRRRRRRPGERIRRGGGGPGGGFLFRRNIRGGRKGRDFLAGGPLPRPGFRFDPDPEAEAVGCGVGAREGGHPG